MTVNVDGTGEGDVATAVRLAEIAARLEDERTHIERLIGST